MRILGVVKKVSIVTSYHAAQFESSSLISENGEEN